MTFSNTVVLMVERSGFLNPPQGLVVELVTPLTGAGKLDVQGLARLVEHVLPGADGLLVGSPAVGEGLALPAEVRRELVAQSLELVRGRLPLILGITGDTPEATREWSLAARAEKERQSYGGPLFLVDLPLWHHSNRGLPRYYQELLAEAALPLLLLNAPQVVGRRAPLYKHKNIRTQVVKKLSGLPGVCGLIHHGEMRRFLNYHLAALARPDFALYEADEHRFLTRPGAYGVVSPGAQLAPLAWRRVVRACLHPEEVADDPETRLDLWQESTRLLNLAGLYSPNPGPLLKAALAARGIIAREAVAPGTAPAALPERQNFLEFPLDV